MKVRELVTTLQALLDQNATVVIGDGVEQETWLVVSGVVERRIAPINPSVVGPGEEPAIEIVWAARRQREKRRNAITRTGIVPAAATAKMKRISRTTCGTVHDVHFSRYAKFSRQPFSCTTVSYLVEPMAAREAIAFSRSLA